MDRSTIKSTVSFAELITVLVLANYVHSKGCVQLDSFSFEKVVSKFKASLVKFDAAYPYGPKQEEFEKVCEASSSIDDLLLVEIAVKDYGEKENSNLAQQYGVNKDDFPVVKLFVQGKKEPFSLGKEEEYTAENLKKFIRAKSGVYIGCTGCLQAFDNLIVKFNKETLEEKRKKLLLEAESLLDNINGNRERKSAEIYMKILRKVLEKGDNFLNNEILRLDSLLKGKVNEEKKNEMLQRINILQAFKIKAHDEF